MAIRKSVLALACVACALLSACTLAPGPQSAVTVPNTTAPEPGGLSAQYAPQALGPGRVMRLQPEASQVRIYVFRAGRSAGLGHNHVLSAPQFEGYFHLADQGLAQSRFELVFALDQLVFDVPAQRAELGPAFAAQLSDALVEATREHMLGADNMQAERYPLVRIRSLSISGEAPKLAARLAVEMHGQTREMSIPLAVSGLPQSLQVSGAFVLRQSDFGVRPYSVMGGLLAVQDEVLVEFNLRGE